MILLHTSDSYNVLSPAHIIIWELEGGGWVVVWLVVDLIAGRGGYKRRVSRAWHLCKVPSCAWYRTNPIYIKVLLQKNTLTRWNNWKIIRRICVLIPGWGTETYRELWDISFILFLFFLSTFFLILTQPMRLLICWFIQTIDNVFTLKNKKRENAHLQPQFTS